VAQGYTHILTTHSARLGLVREAGRNPFTIKHYDFLPKESIYKMNNTNIINTNNNLCK
jgi:hypothetical protein